MSNPKPFLIPLNVFSNIYPKAFDPPSATPSTVPLNKLLVFSNIFLLLFKSLFISSKLTFSKSFVSNFYIMSNHYHNYIVLILDYVL